MGKSSPNLGENRLRKEIRPVWQGLAQFTSSLCHLALPGCSEHTEVVIAFIKLNNVARVMVEPGKISEKEPASAVIQGAKCIVCKSPPTTQGKACCWHLRTVIESSCALVWDCLCSWGNVMLAQNEPLLRSKSKLWIDSAVCPQGMQEHVDSFKFSPAY